MNEPTFNSRGQIEENALKNNTRSNYIWNMLGTVSSSLISVTLLLLASRLLTPFYSDIFSIAYALGQQFFVLGYFQVRNLQATDIKEKYKFSAYHNTRIFTVFLMLVTTLFYILWQGYDTYKASIVFLLILYRAIDAYSDVFQGFFQQKSRSDLAGKIQFYRSWFCILVFALVLWLTKSLMGASVAICCMNFLLTFPLDFKNYRRYFSSESLWSTFNGKFKSIFSILKHSFPLFLNGFLITYIYNEPKIVIDQLLAEGILPSGMQRDFNILFMPVFVLSLLFFVLRPLTTQLSIYWAEKKYNTFFKQVNILYVIMMMLGMLIIVLGYFLGTEILGIVYGINLVKYKIPFTILLIGGILNVLALVVDIIMTIFRKQSYLMSAYVITFLVSKGITSSLIKAQDITGAANSFLISMTIYFAISFLIYFTMKYQLKKEK